MLGRRDDQEGVAVVEIVRDRRSRGSTRASGTPFRKTVFSWAPLTEFDDFRLARPEQHAIAARRRDLGESGAPGAGADHPNPHAFTHPTPRSG